MTISNNYWYNTPDRTAELITSAVRNCADQHSSRRADDALFQLMYGQRDIFGSGETTLRYDPDKLSYNICRAVVNTAQAHIAANKSRPVFLTNDADWTLARKAQKCELAVNAVFYANNYYKLRSLAFVDAAVSSVGALKVFGDNGAVKIERVFPGELLVDIREGYYGDPPNLYQCKLIDKNVLKSHYPTASWAIDSTTTGDMGLFQWLGYESTDNQALVMEAWHLPDSKGKGGKHVIAVRNGVLFEEDWNRPEFPFGFYRWETRQAGWYGMGIVEELRYYQRSLNFLDIRIKDMIHANSRSTLVVPHGAKANIEHISNNPRDILRIATAGEKPYVWVSNAVPPELWQERKDIINSAFLQIGVNRMQMAGEKPPGIQAAVALRELNDQGSKRFRLKIQDIEQLDIDVAKLVINELKFMAEKDELTPIKSRVKKRHGTYFEDVDWTKVALEEDDYHLEVQSASSLPQSTAGRIQTVQDWYEAGFIDQKAAKALLDFPDLDAYSSLDLASHEIILDNIESIIEDGVYVFPEPTDDLELSIQLATQSYNKYRLRKAPTDRLELLLQYIDDVKHWQEEALKGANEMQQIAAGVPSAVSGIRAQLPGGGTNYEAARLLETGTAIQQGQQPTGGPTPAPQPQR